MTQGSAGPSRGPGHDTGRCGVGGATAPRAMGERAARPRPAMRLGRVVHDQLDSNIVAVSLPSIARDLSATFADIEWVVSAYVLTFAALLMPSGALADRYGRRRMLTVGLAIFTSASLLCGLAPSASVLNAARALQGVGAAIELSAALGHAFQGAERAKAFGFWGTVVGLAVALGPLVGGVITSTLGWRWGSSSTFPSGARSSGLRLTPSKSLAIPTRRDWILSGCCRLAAASSV
jgi:MFS family permease